MHVGPSWASAGCLSPTARRSAVRAGLKGAPGAVNWISSACAERYRADAACPSAGPVSKMASTALPAPVKSTQSLGPLQALRPGASPPREVRANGASSCAVQAAFSVESACSAVTATTAGEPNSAAATSADPKSMPAPDKEGAAYAEGDVGVGDGVSIGGTSSGCEGVSDMRELRGWRSGTLDARRWVRPQPPRAQLPGRALEACDPTSLGRSLNDDTDVVPCTITAGIRWGGT